MTDSSTIAFFRKHLATSGGVESFLKRMMQRGRQNVHTPFHLCKDIIRKLAEYTVITDKKIAVLFNVEFLQVFVSDFGVLADNVFMFVDDEVEMEFCKLQYGLTPGKNLFLIDMEKTIAEKSLFTAEGKCDMKFDVIVGNPPYQPPVAREEGCGGSGSGGTLWDKFVTLSIDLVKDDGFVCLVHPAKWRKPNDSLWKQMRNKKLHYLEIHNDQDGKKIFGATTRYDWYVLQNCLANGSKTVIKDELGNQFVTDLSRWPFLPNFAFDLVESAIAKGDDIKCEVIFSFSEYEHRKPWMSKVKTVEFKYPCIHWTGKTEPFIKYMYSSEKKSMFGVPKLIFSETRSVANAVVDFQGQYGLTNQSIGLAISSQEEGEQIKKALESVKFNNFLEACRWSMFRIDYLMFKYFKKDFWKAFLDEKPPVKRESWWEKDGAKK